MERETGDPSEATRVWRFAVNYPERIAAMLDRIEVEPRYRDFVADRRALDTAHQSGEISQDDFYSLVYIRVRPRHAELLRQLQQSAEKPQGGVLTELVEGVAGHYARVFMWLAALVVFGLVGSWVVNWWNGVP
jgi:hypothetical protein